MQHHQRQPETLPHKRKRQQDTAEAVASPSGTLSPNKHRRIDHADEASVDDDGGLPGELIEYIFERLPFGFLLACRLVCRSWRDILRVDMYRDGESSHRLLAVPSDGRLAEWWMADILTNCSHEDQPQRIRYLLWLLDDALPHPSGLPKHLRRALFGMVSLARTPEAMRHLHDELDGRGFLPLTGGAARVHLMSDLFRSCDVALCRKLLAYPHKDDLSRDHELNLCAVKLVSRPSHEAIPLLKEIASRHTLSPLLRSNVLTGSLAAPDCEDERGTILPDSAFAWLRMRGAPCNFTTALAAASLGRLGALQLMAEMGVPFDWPKLVLHAARGKQIAVLEWIHEAHDFADNLPHAILAEAALYKPGIPVVRWLLDRGYAADTDLSFSCCNCAPLLVYVVKERGCPVDWRAIDDLGWRLGCAPHARVCIEWLVRDVAVEDLWRSELAPIALINNGIADMKWALELGLPLQAHKCFKKILAKPTARHRVDRGTELQCVRFLVEERGARPSLAHLLKCARDAYFADVLDYLLREFPPDEPSKKSLALHAARSGCVEALKVMARRGCERSVFHADTLSAAVRDCESGRSSVVEWLTGEGGAEIDASHMRLVWSLRVARLLLRRAQPRDDADPLEAFDPTAFLERWVAEKTHGEKSDVRAVIDNVLRWALRTGICASCILDGGAARGGDCRCDVVHRHAKIDIGQKIDK
jgi:hypothetical protein